MYSEKKQHEEIEKAPVHRKRREVWLIMRANRLHRNALEKSLKNLNIHRSQHMLLMAISHSSESVSQKMLAERMQITPAAVAMTLKKLEQSGYILRETDCNDGRVNNIRVSEKGKQVVLLSEEAFARMDEAMLDGIDANKMAVFVEVMEKINNNLLAIGAEDKR